MTTALVHHRPIRDEAWLKPLVPSDAEGQEAYTHGQSLVMHDQVRSLLDRHVKSVSAPYKVRSAASANTVHLHANSKLFVQRPSVNLVFAVAHSAGPMFDVQDFEMARVRDCFHEFHVGAATAARLHTRLVHLAQAFRLAGLRSGVAYEVPEEQVAIEFGPAKRTLTILVSEVHTRAIFRTGDEHDYGQVDIRVLGRAPAAAEVEKLAADYLISLCQTSLSKTTSLEIAPSVAA